MASGDDLEFSFLDLPETFGALTDSGGNSSLLVSENEHNDFVGLVPSSAATSDVFPSTLIENSNTDQGTLTRTSSFDQATAIVPQNQSFRQDDNYANYFNTAGNFQDMSSCVFGSDQRENVYGGNCVPTSSYKMMTTGQPSMNSQHGPLEQSYQPPLLPQTTPGFFNEPYVPTMVRSSNMQEVKKANEPTNLNQIHHGLQDQHFHPSNLYQGEQYDHNDLLLEQLRRIHEAEYQVQLPRFSYMSTPTSMGTLLNNQCLIPFPSTPNTIMNPEHRTPMISNTLTLNTSGNYSPFMNTSYQPDALAYAFQKSSSLNPARRPRGRPRRFHQSFVPSSFTSTTPNYMPLVPTTQTLLTPPLRPYFGQDKGKQHVTGTSMPSLNPTLYNQYQNSYTNSMIQQSGGLRQRSCYDQLENEGSSSKIRRITFPFQETSIAASSTISPWQDGNMRLNAANHHEERLQNTVYDPLYAGVGLPIDPHLRFF